MTTPETWPYAGDQLISYDGVEMAVRDCPDRLVRVLAGFGHDINERPVAPGRWPFMIDRCEWADQPAFRWNPDGTLLRCLGCGLDGT